MADQHPEDRGTDADPSAPSREELRERFRRRILEGVIDNPAYRVPEWAQKAIWKLATFLGGRVTPDWEERWNERRRP